MLLRPSASHTCGKAVGEIVTRLCGWFPVQKSGGVTWYKSSERCHESPHVHTPWNRMSQQGRGRELSYPMLDNHLKLDFYFLVVGRTSMLHFPAQKSWNKSPYFIETVYSWKIKPLLMEIHWAVHALPQRHKEEPGAKLKAFLQNESLPLSTRFHNTELVSAWTHWNGLSCPLWHLIWATQITCVHIQVLRPFNKQWAFIKKNVYYTS